MTEQKDYDFRDDYISEDEGITVVGKGGKYGYINREGVEITPLKYNEVRRFHSGRGKVKLGRKWGFVDRQGKEFVPLVYSDIIEFIALGYNPVAIVRIGRKFGYLNIETGEPLTPVKYDKVESWTQLWGDFPFKFKEAATVKCNGKWGIINKEGEEVVPCEYEETHICQSEYPHFAVKLNGKWDFIGNDGKPITDFKYDDMDRFISGRARVKKDGKYGFINTEGEVVVPLAYDDCEQYFAYHLSADNSQQLNTPIWVKRGDKYGFVDISGSEIVEPQYEFARPFRRENAALAAVVKNCAVGFIDVAGKLVIPCMYEPDFKCPHSYRFSGDANVKLDGKWGVIDAENRVVIPFLYDRFLATHWGAGFRVGIRKRRKVSIDKKGNEWAMKKNPAARTFKDYLHTAEWAEVAESFKTLLNQTKEEDMKIWEVNFQNFRSKQFKPSNDVIRIYSICGNPSRVGAVMYNTKSGKSYAFSNWAEILDMEVRIEDNLTLSKADIVAICIWVSCDLVAGTEEKFTSYLGVLGEYGGILREEYKDIERRLK